jgi:hypothetical protein
MKNFKKLSREELKNAFGGKRTCTLTVKGANGQWVTLNGTCETSSNVHVGMSTGELLWGMANTTSYCETGLGQIKLTSNGGNSRC